MKVNTAALCLFIFLTTANTRDNLLYMANPETLKQNRLAKLPLGSIKARAWLQHQLLAQANGLTGHLDEFWPDIINSAWKGGEGGDAWERTPYYLDGLVPLAYILDDSILQAKAQPFIEWILASQQEDGWFGPGQRWETWPQAIANKVLSSYYETTGDKRALAHISNYFAYLDKMKPDFPAQDWRGQRAMEHAVTGYWLYRQTGDKKILITIKKIYENSPDWTLYYEEFPWDEEAVLANKIPHNWGADGLTAHVVNNAMAFKYPGLYYQQSGQERHKNAVYAALEQYKTEHGQVGGRFSGDEHLSGRRPIQGTEMCAVVESMFSLEKLLEVYGDVAFADQLELLAYNSLPGTMTPDCWAHQYDQQANQVLCTVAKRDWSTNGDYSNIYGLMPNYPCCLANFHQGWPKFVEHMWYATPDSGLAAVTYGPNVVTARVDGDREVNIIQETNYPFSDTLTFTIHLAGTATFPLYFRLPGWCENYTFSINKTKQSATLQDGYLAVNREWNNADVVTLVLPMALKTEKRYNNAIAIRRGPLYFALRIDKDFKEISVKEKSFQSIAYKGSRDWEIRPVSEWNYGLAIDPAFPAAFISVDAFLIHEYPFADRGDLVYLDEWDTHVTWHHEAPLVLRAPAKKIPAWGLANNSADDPPAGPVTIETEIDSVELVPYGCARLRISEFPIVDR
ncbi:glycoside hydrolase family 127 protein [candidate division KSB1 bacterium]|nr:glycoside hydrolase family 127 protein [candidate division KSB1 bacterium]